MKKNVLVFLFFILLAGCFKEDTDELEVENYFIFGHFYGECMGETCIETYKLTESAMYEDTRDVYGISSSFDFVEMGHDKFLEVNDLPEYFPEELLHTDTATFGCPDCVDQGGLLIVLYEDDQRRVWKIDMVKEQVPAYLHEFMDRVKEKIAILSE